MAGGSGSLVGQSWPILWPGASGSCRGLPAASARHRGLEIRRARAPPARQRGASATGAAAPARVPPPSPAPSAGGRRIGRHHGRRDRRGVRSLHFGRWRARRPTGAGEQIDGEAQRAEDDGDDADADDHGLDLRSEPHHEGAASLALCFASHRKACRRRCRSARRRPLVQPAVPPPRSWRAPRVRPRRSRPAAALGAASEPAMRSMAPAMARPRRPPEPGSSGASGGRSDTIGAREAAPGFGIFHRKDEALAKRRRRGRECRSIGDEHRRRLFGRRLGPRIGGLRVMEPGIVRARIVRPRNVGPGIVEPWIFLAGGGLPRCWPDGRRPARWCRTPPRRCPGCAGRSRFGAP